MVCKKCGKYIGDGVYSYSDLCAECFNETYETITSTTDLKNIKINYVKRT